jgi:hypothetical protein
VNGASRADHHERRWRAGIGLKRILKKIKTEAGPEFDVA